MIIQSREIQAYPNEVFRKRDGKTYAYLRKIDALPIIAKIKKKDYALIQEGDKADVAISMIQQFNRAGENGTGLQFFPMLQESIRNGTPLATQKRLIQHLINVNSAIKGEGVLYDASGNLIEGDKLVKYAESLYHNRWAYLNGRFPQGQGFRGLDFVTIEADGKETRVSLMPCLEDACYAELGSMNEQGLLTRRDSVQRYKPGENLYFFPPVVRANKPEEGYVARLSADPASAWVSCGRRPDYAYVPLGGIPCAEGARVGEANYSKSRDSSEAAVAKNGSDK